MNTAQLHRRFLLCSGVSTDTRNIKNNSLFFALKGPNFNGNLYAEDALKKGARYVVVDDKTIVKDEATYILVNDCLESLQKLATFHRQFLDIPIIALTGSNGKTTTKELINTVLAKRYRTIATQGNLNNHIGVPLTLLAMDEDTEIGVVEMGANHQGEIEFLSEIALPNYGYITNFGKAHLEGFGSLEGVIKGKSELYNHLKKHKKLMFLNLNDPIQNAQLSYNHTFTFGSSNNAHVKINFTTSEKHSSHFSFNKTKFKPKLSGFYNGLNAAAAVCIGLYFKVSLNDIQDAINTYKATNNRSQLVETKTNSLFLDAYNANPTSMEAALTNFAEIENNKSKIAILGDMLELGKFSKKEHQEIVNKAKSKNFEQVFLVGPHFSATNIPTNFKTFPNTLALQQYLEEHPFQQKLILIKGSRGIALEKITKNL